MSSTSVNQKVAFLLLGASLLFHQVGFSLCERVASATIGSQVTLTCDSSRNTELFMFWETPMGVIAPGYNTSRSRYKYDVLTGDLKIYQLSPLLLSRSNGTKTLIADPPYQVFWNGHSDTHELWYHERNATPSIAIIVKTWKGNNVTDRKHIHQKEEDGKYTCYSRNLNSGVISVSTVALKVEERWQMAGSDFLAVLYRCIAIVSVSIVVLGGWIAHIFWRKFLQKSYILDDIDQLESMDGDVELTQLNP